MQKTYYNMPDFITGKKAYTQVLNWMREAPYIFYDDVEIVSIFGCPTHCIWNGGGCGVYEDYFITVPQLKDLIELYNYQYGIPVRFTFTNPCVEEKHFYDSFGNVIANLGHNGMNEILVSEPNFENYLRENYPDYRYVKSIIGTKDEPVFLDDKYYMTVMRRRMNNNWQYLETIPKEKRGKIEFLCTDPCPDNCPRIYNHYRNFAKSQLTLGACEHNMNCNMDNIKTNFQRHAARNLETYISREKIINEYVPRGFNIFKISGRYSPAAIIVGITEYLIKPEYKTDVTEMLIAAYTQKGGLRTWL